MILLNKKYGKYEFTLSSEANYSSPKSESYLYFYIDIKEINPVMRRMRSGFSAYSNEKFEARVCQWLGSGILNRPELKEELIDFAKEAIESMPFGDE